MSPYFNATNGDTATVDLAKLGDGVRTLNLSANDPVGHTTLVGPVTVKIDRAKPSIELGGELSADADAPLTGDAYDLYVSSNDASSGVRSISIGVNSAQPTVLEQQCPDGGCSLDMVWTFTRESYPPGSYTVHVTTTDFAGNATTVDLPVVVSSSRTASPPDDEDATVARSPSGTNSYARSGNGGCPSSLVDTTSPAITAIVDGVLGTTGLQSTVRYIDDSYQVVKCNLDGTLVRSQTVAPLATPDGTRMLAVADIKPAPDGSGDLLESNITYGDLTDPSSLARWQANKSAWLNAVLPPTPGP